MTATLSVRIKCDGWWAGRCPSRSQYTVQADNKTEARRQAEQRGWTYRRTKNEFHNVIHKDVCPGCGAYNVKRSET